MKITKASVSWDGIVANLNRALKEWHPEDFKKESEYRDSLLAYLRECAPDARITREYRHLGTTVDLFLEWPGFFGKDAVFIELKRNLTHKAQLDRLIGQIECLQPKKHNIVVLLCGETDQSLLERLKEHYEHYGWTVHIFVQKPAALGASG